MPKPGCIIFQRIPLFSSLTFKSSDMKRFLLPIAAVALCVAANTASAETPATVSLTAGVTNAATAADATRSAAFVTAAAVPPAKTSEAITAAAGPAQPEDSVRMYRLQFSATPNRPHQAFAEHHRILDAIAERDGELAELLMRRHIGASKRNIERHYQEALANPSKTRGES